MGVGDDVPPRFTQKPAIKQEDNGQRLVFHCVLQASPPPEISWFLGSTLLQESSRIRMRTEPAGGSSYNVVLEVVGVSQDDAGSYKVVAKNRLGESSASINLNFGGKKTQGQDGKAPHFTQKPAIKQQQNLLLMVCTLEAKPSPQIKWFRDTTEVQESGRHSISLKQETAGSDVYTAVLQIQDPSTDDAGIYKCTASNELGESNANITLNMQGGQKAAKPGGIAPTFKEKPKISQDPSGKNIIIECRCTASPKPSVTWYKGASALVASSRVVPTLTENGNEYLLKLEIQNVTKDDGGQYKVTAKNDLGEGNANISLNLEGPKEAPPVLEGKPSIRLNDNGTVIVIEQEVKCAIEPTVSWYFGNQPLKPDGRFKMSLPQEKGSYHPTLQINNFTEKDSGSYKLVLKTGGGEATSTASVNVSALKPKAKGEPVKITQKLNPKIVNDGDQVEFVVQVTGTEPVEVSWAKDKKPIKHGDIYSLSYDKGTAKMVISEVFPEDSGIYSVEVKNQWGSASSSANLQVKDLPEEKVQNDKSKVETKPQKKEEPKIEPKSEPKQESVPPPKGKQDSQPNKKPAELSKDVNEPLIKKKEESKVSAPPAIVVEDEEETSKTKSGAGKHKGGKHVKKGPQLTEDPDSDEEVSVKSRGSKSKGGKVYVKKPTTILEELEEDGMEGESDTGYDADEDRLSPYDVEDMDEGKMSVDQLNLLKDAKKPLKLGEDGPSFKEKPSNQVVVEGDDLRMTVTVDPKGKPVPLIKFYRGGRELKDDSRVTIKTNGLASVFGIKRTRLTDEAKYTVNIESEGAITDTATFSIFIKDPKDSAMDYRALLKHREHQKNKEEGEEPDWNSLKPESGSLAVDKKGRRLSQIEVMKMSLKKVEAAGSDSEEEKLRVGKKDITRRESRAEYERDGRDLGVPGSDDKVDTSLNAAHYH